MDHPAHSAAGRQLGAGVTGLRWSMKGLWYKRHEFPHEIIAGCTSQIFRKLGGRWLVVHENSARVPKD